MWEYMEIATNHSQMVIAVNDDPINHLIEKSWIDLGYKLFPNYINQIGGEGWELVGFTRIGAPDVRGYISFIFKRPVLIQK